MKMIIFFIYFAIINSSFAVDSVRIYDVEHFVASAVTPQTFSLGTAVATAAASIVETTAPILYLPVANTTTPNAAYFYTPTATLFSATDATQNAQVTLTVNTSTNKYLYGAVKASSGYVVFNAYSFTTRINTGGVDTNYIFSINLKQLCDQLTATNVCATLNSAETGSPISELLYFFTSASVLGLGSPATPTINDYTNGVYLNLQLSNKVYPTPTVVASNVVSGDARASVDYTSSYNISTDQFKGIVIISSPTTANTSFGASGGTLFSADFSGTSQNGTYLIYPLINNIPFNFSVAMQDKFLFISATSNIVNANPRPIQELLKKQSCFFLTAGFGGDHYVVRYFRHFRDTVLLTNSAGKVLVSYYYKLAPQYAMTIYNSPSLSRLIRTVGYTAYFVFNHIWSVILLVFFSLLYFKIFFFKKVLR